MIFTSGRWRLPANGLLALSALCFGLVVSAAAQGASAQTVVPPRLPSRSPATLPPPGTPWTLDLALARAMEANADLLTAKYEFERQEGVRLQIQARLFPLITASGSATQRDRGLVDESPSQRLAPPSPDTSVALYNYDMRVEIRQVLFDGLSSWHQAKRQKLITSQAYLTLRNVALHTATLVRQAFDGVQLRTTLLAAEQRRVEEFQKLLNLAQKKQSAGEIRQFEVLRVEAELYGARADSAEATRALGQSEQVFRRLLQIPQMAGPLRLQGTFQPRAFDLPLDKAVEQAWANRPDLKAAGLAVDAAKANVLSQYGNYLPKVEGFLSYGRRSSYYNSGVQLDGWTYGAIGQWTIFDSGGQRGRRLAALAERRAAENKLAEIQHQIGSRLTELYEGVDQSRVAMAAQQKSVEISLRASTDTQRSYERGEANLEQLLQAEIGHRRAESGYNEAVYNYNSLVAEVEFAVGGQLADTVATRETWKH